MSFGIVVVTTFVTSISNVVVAFILLGLINDKSALTIKYIPQF